MTALDFVHLAAWALGAALVVGIVALLVLRLLRRVSLVAQIAIVAVAAIGSLVGGMVVAADQMYLSAHDFHLFLWVAAVAGVVSVGLALVLGFTLVRNSRELIAQAKRVGSGSVDSLEPASAPVANEFAALARELAASDSRLRESRDREARAESARRELVAWISHDLRTPLAGLRAMAEALQDGIVADPARYHQQMLAQVDKLGGMVDDLFQLSTIHAGALKLTVQKVRTSELLDDIVTELEPVSSARGVVLVARDVADVTLDADPDELTRAMANLIMNSVRLSPVGAEIELAVAVDGDDVVLSVSDAAGGINEADLGRVFEPGWQAGKARTPGASGGAGLGLAIVEGIITAHRGRVRVQNTGAGCRFDLIVPQRVVG
ncbi:histidine kinase [Frondihabitans sp. PhB188]|uniref:sensor histidine kinase n=1 Tax=Frondihabitans sp. PhB188 TaxID=2485200 RepID=UPI000F4A3EA2|nr:HAMP domain-containing sensor histidine kinase [Frondihabitans sp. PhB188]ROQ38570.1 histidine kinase [Frondihabitans sp. PhB188]